MRKSRWHGVKVHTANKYLGSIYTSVVPPPLEAADETISKTNPTPPDLHTSADRAIT